MFIAKKLRESRCECGILFQIRRVWVGHKKDSGIKMFQAQKAKQKRSEGKATSKFANYKNSDVQFAILH